ncbi:ATP-binding protein [Streptomyces sp. NPDC059080]|uniref:ATP-binding protein n=1 Tax=Streptomyces sp. NPDC059080 TaxID=3346718 RepID=UPI0036B5BEB2
MTSNLDGTVGPGQPARTVPHLSAAADPDPRVFAMRFTGTPRGARLARRLVAVRLDEWGVPYGTGPHDTIVLIAGELSANAVRHGRVPGRDFQLRLCLATGAPDRATVRVEVGDTRTERVPPRPGAVREPGDRETGRGLLLVSRLATRWDWHPRPGGPGKTVWAEYVLTHPFCP